MRLLHAFCVCFTPGLPAVPVKYRAKPLGMVPVEEYRLIMKLRGMRLELPTEGLRPAPFCFFFGPTTFLSFYLTGVGVFYNHHRSLAD
jgi:hypothetical protein